MSNKYPTIVHEWFEEVWNHRNASTIDRLLHENTVVHGITDANGAEIRGPKGFREFHRRFLDAFPDIKVEVLDTVTEGEKIAARCRVRGTHQGDGLGIPASHRQTEITGMCFAHVHDGKIVEAYNDFDFLKMHLQLGTLAALVPASANTKRR